MSLSQVHKLWIGDTKVKGQLGCRHAYNTEGLGSGRANIYDQVLPTGKGQGMSISDYLHPQF